MPDEKRVKDKEEGDELLLNKVLNEKRPGGESLWKGSLGGEPGNEVFETVSALRDFTAEPNEREPDGYLPEKELREAS